MFLIYTSISILLILCYLIIILYYIYHWNRLKTWQIPSKYAAQTTVSVIVAARNEAKTISTCLNALLAQEYPKNLVTIWIVNDHSDDNTATIVESYAQDQIQLLNLPKGKSGKKQAIEFAIQQSQSTLIVCTDADCIMEKNWLNYIVSYYQTHQPKFIAAPVSFHREKSLFERFQSLDFMGMMAVSGAGINGQFMYMCNGANLAYERTAFEAVNGFEGINHLASGDDMLLLQKIAQQAPDKIGYLKNPQAQTLTSAKSTIQSFFQQRIRWASKSSAYTNWQVLFMLGIVWLLCLSLCIDLLLIAYHPVFLWGFLFKFFAKAFADFFLLRMMAHFFGRPQLMTAFIPSLFFHWWYITIIGSLSHFIKNYSWKGRTVR